MKKVLTSLIAISFAMPAFATIQSGSTCDTTNLGQSENNSTANVEATWTANQYSEAPGRYLLFSNDTITQNQECPAGSYCTGFTNQTFNDASMGLASCPTGYTSSAAGTSSQNDCYNPGTATCSTVNPYTGGHATAVTYGNSTNGTTSCKTYYGDQTTCVLDTATACDITGLTCATGYHQESVAVPGTNPMSNIDITIDADWDGAHARWKPINGDSGYTVAQAIEENDLVGGPDRSSGLENGEWEIIFSYGTLRGRALCSTTSGEQATSGNPVETGGGQYCWCKTTDYTPTSGTNSSIDSPWVFYFGDFGVPGDCTSYCAVNCANNEQNNYGFREALALSVGARTLICSANTINIDWDPKNGEQHTTNQCTYDDTITLPTQPSKIGYTFGGWTLKQTTPISEPGNE